MNFIVSLAAVGTVLAVTVGAGVGSPARASNDPILAGCDDTELPRNDDGSSSQLGLPFDITFGGESFDTAWVNNNGNVTFDGEMSTYTPFGLAGTSRQIIAPFFADVDTRAEGSRPVTYSWGTTTYQGRSALCVNYIDVGYFQEKADKTNAFQLVLVDRNDVSPGSFDIMFNYRRVAWETGDASGGYNGFGGTSAAIGFSNGSSEYFEMPGSLTPGSFIDGGPQSVVNRSNVGTPGRWVWPMRSGVSPTNYVALGDSFQSGEGAYDYEAGTDIASNRCHRSSKAYARLITQVGGPYQLGIAVNTKFVACSGARMAQMTQAFDSEKGNEPPQFNALGDDTALVTVGIAGNDLEFAKTITACVEQGIGTQVLLDPVWNYASCQRWKGSEVESRLQSLTNGDLHTKLSEVYAGIRSRARRAKVVVITYPQFFRPPNWVESRGNCAGVRGSDQTWINDGIRRADEQIANLARSYGFAVADVSTAFGDRHGLCSGDEAMNGLIFSDGDDDHKPGRGSYHPNKLGHELFAQKVKEAFDSRYPNRSVLGDAPVSAAADGGLVSETVQVLQGGSVVRHVSVEGTDLSVNTQWQDGTIGLRLISPSGVSVDAASPGDADIQVGDTYERIYIPGAERGQWTVEVKGNLVPTGTQDVHLGAASTPLRNASPSPVSHATVDAAGNVRLDASGSTDPEGEALTYGWDFGDGQSAAGLVVAHHYGPGSYIPSLVVTDSSGNSAVKQVNVIVRQPSEGPVSLVNVDDDGNAIAPTPTLSPTTPDGKSTSSVTLARIRATGKKTVTPASRVTLRATVSPASATGAVVFSDSGHTLGKSPLRAGVATLVAKGIYGGKQRITARYTGDSGLEASTSMPVALTVKDKTKPAVAKPRIAARAAHPVVRIRARDTGGIQTVRLRWRATPADTSKLGRWHSVRLLGDTASWSIPGATAKASYCVSVRARNFAGVQSAWRTSCRRLR
ncbi:MAG: nidogen-like domain-containing protein [Candidatus Nanopelagicales bacterium]